MRVEVAVLSAGTIGIREDAVVSVCFDVSLRFKMCAHSAVEVEVPGSFARGLAVDDMTISDSRYRLQ